MGRTQLSCVCDGSCVPVFQDGKDYIPLNAILTSNSGFTYSTPAFSEDFFKEDISAPKFNSASSDNVR